MLSVVTERFRPVLPLGRISFLCFYRQSKWRLGGKGLNCHLLVTVISLTLYCSFVHFVHFVVQVTRINLVHSKVVSISELFECAVSRWCVL